jgi:hypothetical protein
VRLASQSLFIDLVSQVADAGPAPEWTPSSEAVRAECLTGWDQAFIWFCRGSRPESRLAPPHDQTVQNRLGFPSWLLEDCGTAEEQFQRLGTWPHFALCAVKVNPLAVALGGAAAVEAATRAIMALTPEGDAPPPPEHRPICALTQGSSQIIVFVHHPEVVQALKAVNRLGRQPIAPSLVAQFRTSHCAEGETPGPPPGLLQRFRRWRYEEAIHGLSYPSSETPPCCRRPVWRPEPDAPPGWLCDRCRAECEAALSRQPLVSRTSTTVCWRPDRSPTAPWAQRTANPSW